MEGQQQRKGQITLKSLTVGNLTYYHESLLNQEEELNIFYFFMSVLLV